MCFLITICINYAISLILLKYAIALMFLVNYTNLKENQFFSDYREKRKKTIWQFSTNPCSNPGIPSEFGPKRLYGAAGFFIFLFLFS